MARSISKRLRFQILRRDGFKCVYCGCSPGDAQLRVDHVIAYSKGGTDDPKNLVTSCFDCNSGKSDTSIAVGGKFIQHGKYRLPETLREVDEELELVRAQMRRKSLKRFVIDAYPHMMTGTNLTWGWYLDAICEHLQALIEGSILRLVINIKNKSFKSGVGSVCLNPWAWLTQPGLRFLTGGYNRDLATRDCWSSRLLIRSAWYQRMIDSKDRWYLDERVAPDPTWALADDQDQKSFYANSLGGRRIAVQVGGGTGHGAHVFLIDDPLSIDQSYSDTENETANRWFFQTIMSRLDDPKNARLCIIQHRLRTDDTSGEALRRNLGFEVLSLPLEYDPKRIMPVTSIGWRDPRTEKGESLCPERWGDKEIANEKESFNDLYEAIANQNPQKRGRPLLQREWFKVWGRDKPFPARFERVQSWDLSTKGLDPTIKQTAAKKRSKVGGLVAAFTSSECFLVDCYHQHADYIEQKRVVRQKHAEWTDTRRTYVEDESNGSALILELGTSTNGETGIPGIVGVNPSKKGGKYQRLAAIAHFVRAGNVYVPDPEQFEWVRELIDTLCNFPNVEYDELPDVFSQMLSEEWLPDGLPKRGEDTAEERAAGLVSVYSAKEKEKEPRPRFFMPGG